MWIPVHKAYIQDACVEAVRTYLGSRGGTDLPGEQGVEAVWTYLGSGVSILRPSIDASRGLVEHRVLLFKTEPRLLGLDLGVDHLTELRQR